MSKLEDAEKAIEDLHEQRVLVPEQREMGPMQVAHCNESGSQQTKGKKKHINFFNVKLKTPTFGARKKVCVPHFLGKIPKERKKRDPHKLFRGNIWGQKGGPKRAIFGDKKFSLLFFPPPKNFSQPSSAIGSCISSRVIEPKQQQSAGRIHHVMRCFSVKNALKIARKYSKHDVLVLLMRSQKGVTKPKIARAAPKNFWTIWGDSRVVLRQIAPESSPEHSAKSLSHSFFVVPFLSPN